jgi:hypothetical protein
MVLKQLKGFEGLKKVKNGIFFLKSKWFAKYKTFFLSEYEYNIIHTAKNNPKGLLIMVKIVFMPVYRKAERGTKRQLKQGNFIE